MNKIIIQRVTQFQELVLLKVHLESCQFSEVRCLNAKCQEKLTRYQIEEHTAYQCAYRLVECPYCDSQVTVFDQEVGKLNDQSLD